MKTYRCPVYMEKSMALVDEFRSGVEELVNENFHSGAELVSDWADQLEVALRQDQHDLFHDGEFADGCDICDKEWVENA